jgi:hypothetical protein
MNWFSLERGRSKVDNLRFPVFLDSKPISLGELRESFLLNAASRNEVPIDLVLVYLALIAKYL